MEAIDLYEILFDNGYWTADDMAEHFNITKRTLMRWETAGKVQKAGYIGRTSFYRKPNENPPAVKGDKQQREQGVVGWYDPFEL